MVLPVTRKLIRTEFEAKSSSFVTNNTQSDVIDMLVHTIDKIISTIESIDSRECSCWEVIKEIPKLGWSYSFQGLVLEQRRLSSWKWHPNSVLNGYFMNWWNESNGWTQRFLDFLKFWISNEFCRFEIVNSNVFWFIFRFWISKEINRFWVVYWLNLDILILGIVSKLYCCLNVYAWKFYIIVSKKLRSLYVALF